MAARKALILQTMRSVHNHISVEANGFGSVLKKVEIVDGDLGWCLAGFRVQEEHTNVFQALHGAFSATLLDNISTLTLITDDPSCLKHLGVSVNMGLQYFKSAKLGSDLLVDARLLKRGRTLGFMEAEIKDRESGEVLVKGTHCKFIA